MEIKFEWTPSMSVGNKIIDEQHKKLLEKINELLTSIEEEQENEVIGKIISFLGDYINEHLRYEEKYMAENFYPDLKDHRRIHGYFVEKYNDFENRFNENGYSLEMLQEVETFLGDWWVKHIGQEDKKYADYIRETKS
ncbi:hypothetical protein A2442_00225 [Candidatus Campbellbacteria bacterium RIFOXYC2_FULL_35_25]|uniref:Hemerythrin-like domain-containing protein n=1 Tax=Candidatus Campbellbacteria bacterium RIFOXYC2_FULL_35_25 TaxID=1797582 RepID=A0A1F5EH25_9BACT|nr:MAG: hypothetical protein A2442_00225 [Candidatus Campbellbacteria bacterium RIFOXYC2_FULL_35_25]